MTARLECQTTTGRVFALCDAADLPRLQKWSWRYQQKRGVVTRDGNSQMQATSLLCGWAQVRFINGDRLDLRRANLGKLLTRGYAPTCEPMKIRENLWRVQRVVDGERLQICFADFTLATTAGEMLRTMTKAEVLAAIARRRLNRPSGRKVAVGYFDGRADIAGNVLDFDDYAMMCHAVNF